MLASEAAKLQIPRANRNLVHLATQTHYAFGMSESLTSEPPTVVSAQARVRSLHIPSPKRLARHSGGWHGFFPYYAGFPEDFASSVIASAGLAKTASVLDPWNGSGTTSFAASRLGLRSVGVDLNPVMAIVAKARALAPSEADTIEPLGHEILQRAERENAPIERNDPLSNWYGPSTAQCLRAIERSARVILLGRSTITDSDVRLENISSIASAYYIALFALCRQLIGKFRSSNPTWLRIPRVGERRVGVPKADIYQAYRAILRDMAQSLALGISRTDDVAPSNIMVADSSTEKIPGKFDLVLTSPPYCTRIDYTAATRIELAVIAPLVRQSVGDLSRQMMGSTRVPLLMPEVQDTWGSTCLQFLEQVRKHRSKASSGYYTRTHLDYFAKLSKSMANIASAMKDGGISIIVAQDSYYKDISNPLPSIIVEMAEMSSLRLVRREDFSTGRTIAASHPYGRNYRSMSVATESVLCFVKGKGR